MAKKKIEVPAQMAEPSIAESVPAPSANYETRKVDALAPVEGFDPRQNLRTVTNGVWRYICKDVDAVKDESFSSPLAREFGIRENDMVYLVGNKKYRIVVV